MMIAWFDVVVLHIGDDPVVLPGWGLVMWNVLLLAIVKSRG